MLAWALLACPLALHQLAPALMPFCYSSSWQEASEAAVNASVAADVDSSTSASGALTAAPLLPQLAGLIGLQELRLGSRAARAVAGELGRGTRDIGSFPSLRWVVQEV